MDASMEVQANAEPSGVQSTSEDDMPEVLALVKADARMREETDAERRKRLALLKRQVLSSNAPERSSDSDDDLEIVPEDKNPALERPRGSTVLEKRLANVAGFRVGASKYASMEVLESSQGDRELKLASKPNFGDRDSRRPRTHLDHRDLQNAILRKATKQSMILSKEKEEEWRRRGGKLAGKQRAALASEPLSLDHLAENLAQQRKRVGQDSRQEIGERNALESEDSDDGEWQPEERGSMSPSTERQGLEDEEELEGTGSVLGEAVPVTQLTDTQETDDGEEDLGKLARRARRTANYLISSDSEGEEMREVRKTDRILIPDTSFVDEGNNELLFGVDPDEENKENDTSLAIDSGDDKENAAPMERLPLGRSYFGIRQRGGIFNLSEGIRHTSLSPMGDPGHEGSPGVRRPLQAKRIGDLDDPFVLQSRSATTSPKTPKSKGGPSAVSSPLSLRPAFDGGPMGFTQLFNDDEGVHPDTSSTGVLQPAFRLHSPGNTPRTARRNGGLTSPQAKVWVYFPGYLRLVLIQYN